MKTKSGPEIECMDCGKKRVAVPGEPLEMGMPACDQPRCYGVMFHLQPRCYGVMFPTGKIGPVKPKRARL